MLTGALGDRTTTAPFHIWRHWGTGTKQFAWSCPQFRGNPGFQLQFRLYNTPVGSEWFLYFKWLTKIKRGWFHGTWELYEIWFLVFTNTALSEHGHTRSVMSCLWLPLHYSGGVEQLWQRPHSPQAKNIYYLTLCREGWPGSAPNQWFPKVSVHQNLLEGLSRCRLLGPNQAADSVDLGRAGELAFLEFSRGSWCHWCRDHIESHCSKPPRGAAWDEKELKKSLGMPST